MMLLAMNLVLYVSLVAGFSPPKIVQHCSRFGAGPTLDFAHATAFLAGFETVIDKVRRRRLQ